MKIFFLAGTSTGLEIPAYEFGTEGPRVLILGGVHGDEREGVDAAYGLLARWHTIFDLRLRVTLMPAVTLDGVLRSQRASARGVDVNRNMATKDWSPTVANPRYQPGPSANSEPETQALVAWIE